MNSTTPNKRIRNITALLLAASTIAACGGSGERSVDDLLGDAQTSSGDEADINTDDDATAEPETTTSDGGDDPDSTEPDDTIAIDEPETSEPGTDEADPSDSTDTGLVTADGPTRFYEIDWTVVETWRWPDGPLDDGEDVDPAEDFIYVSVDAVLPVDSVSFEIPWEWFSLVRPDGAEFQPITAYERSTFDYVGTRIDFEPNRIREFTVTFPIDARDDFEGGYVELDQPGFEPAALGGPNALDETQRIPVSFDATVYEGPYSRDLGEIEIGEAYWSRELGEREDGTLIKEPWLSGSRRPPTDSVFLIVRFSVTCLFSGGISTGGCNASRGTVVVAGEETGGSQLGGSGVVGYDKTNEYWVAYPVPVDAESVSLRLGGDSNFVVTDLSPLAEFATVE